MSRRLKVVGLDPSLTHWGIAIGSYSPRDHLLAITELQTICPALPKKLKQVRQNSMDLIAATQLYQGARDAVQGAHAVFVEVPHGSQSARAMASYGICMGVLAGLRANGHSFYEMNAAEVRAITGLSPKAPKTAVIEWAAAKQPEAHWSRHTHSSAGKPSKNGVIVGAYNNGDLTGTNEHAADAVAAIHAGLNLEQFKQLLSLSAA